MIRTKDEEIEMLQRWYDEAHAEPGSYLAALLSDNLVEYVRGEIEMDGNTNIYAELLSACENRDWYRRDRDAIGENLRKADEELEQLRGQVHNVTIERDKLARDIDARSLNWQEERDRMTNEQTALEDLLVVRDCEINRLKAKLYDAYEAAQGEE